MNPRHGAALPIKNILLVLAAATFCSIPAIVLIYLDRKPFSFKRLLIETPSTLFWYLMVLGGLWIFRRLRKWREQRYAQEIEERMLNASATPKREL